MSLEADSGALSAPAPELTLGLVMADPGYRVHLLHLHTNLLDNHPVRVMILVWLGIQQGCSSGGCAGFYSAVGSRLALVYC
jgi:hypothetical protein